jgi:hypothetical protein
LPFKKRCRLHRWRFFYACRWCESGFSGVKPLISLGWQGAIKKFLKSPKATAPDDDNYYEGSLGHTRRMPGPEAAVSQTRGIRHGINR